MRTELQRALHRKVRELQTNDGHSHVGGIDELFTRGNRVPSSCLEISLRTLTSLSCPELKSSSIPPT